MQVISACNVYRMDDGKFSHMDGTQFRKSYQSDRTVGYDTITSGDANTFRTLDTNTPFVGGLVKQMRVQDQVQNINGVQEFVKATDQNYPTYLKELLSEINTHVGKSFGGTSPYSNVAQGMMMNIEINPYNNTDFMLGSLYHHVMADGKRKEGNYKND